MNPQDPPQSSGGSQSPKSEAPEMHVHGPKNAEHELRKAYNTLIEADLTFSWDRQTPQDVNHQELIDIYKHAYNCYRKGDRLSAERWARTAKHLSRALWCEAKIAFLKPRLNLYPYLEGATPEEYNLHERIDTTADLLDSVGEHVPPGLDQMPEQMTKALSKGRRHLDEIKSSGLKHELLKAEHIKAAHEYGRVIECMALAFEAEAHGKSQAA
ncbi:MAG: hypothetical protein ACJ763_09400 [Bdellovibrionia bacterium]